MPAGAIFGLGGALAVYAARHRKILPGKSGDNLLRSLGQTLAINVVYGLTSPRIDQWCVTGSGIVCFPCYTRLPRCRAHSLPARCCCAPVMHATALPEGPDMAITVDSVRRTRKS